MDIDSDQIRLLRQLAGAQPKHAQSRKFFTPTGHEGIDAVLGGGLAHGQLHELFAGGPGDAAGATAMAALFTSRTKGPAIWLRDEKAGRRLRLHAPGLATLGLDPGRLLLGVLPDADAVLRAGSDVLRCSGVGVLVIELWQNPRNLGLTATRRLQLAAEVSGVTGFLLRINARPCPSAAATRWAVHSIASQPLEANAPGHPAFALELLRHRGGGRGHWQVQWDRDAGCFRDLATAPLSGAVVSLPADRPATSDRALRLAG